MIGRKRKVGTVRLTGDGRPVIYSQVTNAEASWSGPVVHVYADSVAAERLVWDMNIEQAENLLMHLQVCVANAKAGGYATLATSDSGEDGAA